jgi:2-polyprenyl-3-methyl-5-hydroxy-6-metoxy-1,4-benzoquinol methylase
MYENYRRCIICGSDPSYNTILGTFNTLTKVRCKVCGHVYANPVPSEEEYNSWYKLDAFWIKEQQRLCHPTIYDRMEQDYCIANARINYIICELGAKESVGKTMLDVGCSNGSFVRRAVEKGFYCEGIELFQEVVDIARSNSKSIIHKGDMLSVVFDKKFDVIVANDVIEHCYDPLSVLDSIGSTTSDNGLLVIEIPDRECVEAKQQKLEWRHLHYKEHIFLFSLEDMNKLLLERGFIITSWFRPIPAKLSIYARKVSK